MKRCWAYQGWCERCVGQARPQGRNGYGAWQTNNWAGGWTQKNEAAKLLQQFSGMLRFGKRRLHLWASLTERPTLSAVMCCKLYMCLDKLPPEKRKLINRIYFLGYSLRQLSAETGIPYMTIQHRKVKILAKLKKFMENWKKFRAATVCTRL